MPEASADLLRRYLDDAIATERTFGDPGRQDRLTARLHALGGSPSAAKGFLAQLFAAAPEPPRDRSSIVRFAAQQSSVAMYESLAIMADAAGDAETSGLARSLQSEARHAVEEIWRRLPATASAAAEATT